MANAWIDSLGFDAKGCSEHLEAEIEEFRAVLKDLQGYSDRELTELGISRADIARVAYEEAERRIVTPVAQGRRSTEGRWPAAA